MKWTMQRLEEQRVVEQRGGHPLKPMLAMSLGGELGNQGEHDAMKSLVAHPFLSQGVGIVAGRE
jgi:hypothetical protein